MLLYSPFLELPERQYHSPKANTTSRTNSKKISTRFLGWNFYSSALQFINKSAISIINLHIPKKPQKTLKRVFTAARVKAWIFRDICGCSHSLYGCTKTSSRISEQPFYTRSNLGKCLTLLGLEGFRVVA